VSVDTEMCAGKKVVLRANNFIASKDTDNKNEYRFEAANRMLVEDAGVKITFDLGK
jgi:hypothetical protein